MDWVASVIWWHCYPLRFVGGETWADELADGQVEHRLGRIAGWLDYLIDLGANGLMLAPIFASTSHGYDTLDYFRVDPRLGRSGRLRRPGPAAAGSAASGSAWTACSTTSARTTRSSGGRWRDGPRLRAGPVGDVGQRLHDRLRGQPRPGRAELRPSAGGRLHRRRHVLLAGPGCRRLAARRRLRPGVVPPWRPVIDRVRAAPPGGLDRRRADQRRLPGVRGRERRRLGHPVRAVEGDLELAQRPEPPRARAEPDRHAEFSATFRVPDVPRQPRPDPDRDAAHDLRNLPLAVADPHGGAGHPHDLRRATSRRSPERSSTSRSGTTRSGRPSRRRRPGSCPTAPRPWPSTRSWCACAATIRGSSTPRSPPRTSRPPP